MTKEETNIAESTAILMTLRFLVHRSGAAADLLQFTDECSELALFGPMTDEQITHMKALMRIMAS